MPTAFLIIFAIFVLLGVSMKLIYKKKIADNISKYPLERKKKVLAYYSKILKIYKILLWIAPIQLLLTPILVFRYDPSNLQTLLVPNVLLYAYVIGDFYLKKSILKVCGSE